MINVRLAAIRQLAYEASDDDLLPELNFRDRDFLDFEITSDRRLYAYWEQYTEASQDWERRRRARLLSMVGLSQNL